MNAKVTGTLFAVSIAIVGGLNSSCSSSNAPQPGTPAFYWAAANETFTAGDYAKTRDHLEKIVASENEYKARAEPWLLILTSGAIRGYLDVADNLEYGVRAKKGDPGNFRKYISNYRSTAGRLTLNFAEAFMRFQKGKDDPVPLAFGYPHGTAAPLQELTKASEGYPLQPAEIEAAQRRAAEREVLLETCRAAGAPDDTAKTLELFKPGNVQVPRATFLTAMANSLYEQAQLYSPRKLDDGEKLKTFSNLASTALKSIPETKQTKELMAKIEKGQKK